MEKIKLKDNIRIEMQKNKKEEREAATCGAL
jgi:hypothetical protein